jgi:hypothetical protein
VGQRKEGSAGTPPPPIFQVLVVMNYLGRLSLLSSCHVGVAAGGGNGRGTQRVCVEERSITTLYIGEGEASSRSAGP